MIKARVLAKTIPIGGLKDPSIIKLVYL